MSNIISKEELDKLIESEFLDDNQKNIVLFGASNYGIAFLNYLKTKNIKVDYFCDNSKEKWNTTIEKTLVISPDELRKLKNSYIFITSSYYKYIIEQLNEMELKNSYYCDNFYILYKRNIVKNKEYKNKIILYGENGNCLVKDHISKNSSLMVSRIGNVELQIISSFSRKSSYDMKVREMAHINAGIFPTTDKGLDYFSEIYLNSLKYVDIMGVWFNENEGNIIKNYCKKDINLVELTSIDSYRWNEPWSQCLENKKVLVIHPFGESIQKQYKRREKLFKNRGVLPKFSLRTINAVQTAGGNITNFKSWGDALKHMYCQIDKEDFDIAIIGAGAYGLPLAAYIKNKNRIAVHMGGSSQILFGIKGSRWDNWAEVNTLYNDCWIRPSKVEIPSKATLVEDACYW